MCDKFTFLNSRRQTPHFIRKRHDLHNLSFLACHTMPKIFFVPAATCALDALRDSCLCLFPIMLKRFLIKWENGSIHRKKKCCWTLTTKLAMMKLLNRLCWSFVSVLRIRGASKQAELSCVWGLNEARLFCVYTRQEEGKKAILIISYMCDILCDFSMSR